MGMKWRQFTELWLLIGWYKYLELQEYRIIFFLTFSFVDRFLSHLKTRQCFVRPHDLHLISVTSLFIVSKYMNPKNYIQMDYLMDKICLNKFKINDVLVMEREILKGVGFKIQTKTLFSEVIIRFRILLSFNKLQLSKGLI